jgi:acyl-CoA reductase-like NAD-dependent aldehyde dehydrogenase
MEVLNPATGEVIAEVPKAGEEDVDRAVAAAEKAWETWREKTPKDRMELLLGLADVIDDNAEELARLESLNVGKPWWVAVDEPGVMSDNLRFFAGAARNLEGKAAAEYVEGYTSMIRREPLGVVAGIAPWNYPLFMVMWKMGPALAAGNVQIIKPPSRRRSRPSASSSSRRRCSLRASSRSSPATACPSVTGWCGIRRSGSCR